MADLLSIGVSGLLAYRRVLDTTSNNIANANTAGYSRQRVELASRAGSGSGAGYIGGGVEALTVQRSVDGFIGARLQSDASAYARLEVLSGFATRVDGLLSDADAGLSRPLQAFFDAANALAQNPASTSTRQALIGSAQTLSASFQDIQSQLDTLDAEINQRTRVTVEEINTLTRSIADLNQRIALGYGEFGQPPNDLLDQRDRLLEQLSTHVGITTYPQSDSSVNVFVGSGQTLVLGSQASALGLADDAFGSGRLDIVAGGAVITSQIGGGTLGGLLDARREIVDPARAELGRLAVGIADSVNAQHALGVDRYGELGGPFFSEPQGTSIAAGTNTGSAAIGVGFSDVSQLGTGDYELRYDGAAWSLIDSRSGAGVALSGTGTSADPLVGAGLALVVSGTAAAGDRFRVQPTAYAAGNLGVAIADPARIAAATPLRASAALGNTGTASAAVPVVNDASNASLLDTVEITFTGPGSYQIDGAGSFAFTPGTPISVNGWSLTLSGVPAAGDRFTISAAGSDNGDNGNAQALAALGSRGLFDGGSRSIAQAQVALVSASGLRAQQAGLRLDAQAAIREQTLAERESVSGVNLDEEAADLIRFQQAYQAAARVIQVADTVFQTLLQAAGR